LEPAAHREKCTSSCDMRFIGETGGAPVGGDRDASDRNNYG
jgi:hypothetical protein